jgi:hypothetical protein
MDEPWPEDILAVTCVRADQRTSIVPGSLVKTCWRCECSVWVSPATMAHVRSQPHRFLCMECMMHYAAQEPEQPVAEFTPQQVEELKQALAAKGLPIPTDEELEEIKRQFTSQELFPPREPKKRF